MLERAVAVPAGDARFTSLLNSTEPDSVAPRHDIANDPGIADFAHAITGSIEHGEPAELVISHGNAVAGHGHRLGGPAEFAGPIALPPDHIEPPTVRSKPHHPRLRHVGNEVPARTVFRHSTQLGYVLRSAFAQDYAVNQRNSGAGRLARQGGVAPASHHAEHQAHRDSHSHRGMRM